MKLMQMLIAVQNKTVTIKISWKTNNGMNECSVPAAL
jgi:hypothetical protein